MENFDVKSYTRKTKSGKTITVKAHKRGRKGAMKNEEPKSNGIKAKAGEELVIKKEAALKPNELGLYEGDMQELSEIDNNFRNIALGELKDAYNSLTPAEKRAFYSNHVKENLNKARIGNEKRGRITKALEQHLREKGGFTKRDEDSMMDKIGEFYAAKSKTRRASAPQKTPTTQQTNPSGKNSPAKTPSVRQHTQKQNTPAPKKGDELMVRVGNNMFGRAAVKLDKFIQKLEERQNRRRR